MLPWLISDWQRLWEHPQGLPHALLLAGPGGVGKREFANALARRLLCEAAKGGETSCGKCGACRWFDAGNHPDFRRVVPELDAEEGETTEGADKDARSGKKKSSQILVGQVRELADFVYVGAHGGKGRVIVIQPAEAMNAAAANSLLKILEEPPASVYFILVSDNFRRLLPTIRSRCTLVPLSHPEEAAARAWLRKEKPDAESLLELVGGMPLRAAATSELGWGKTVAALEASLADPDQDEMALASIWEGLLRNAEAFGMEDLVTLLQKWLGDLISHQLAGRARYFPGRGEKSRRLLGRTSVAALLHCYNQVQSAKALANHPLNPRLFLEDLAARYLATFAAARGPH